MNGAMAIPWLFLLYNVYYFLELYLYIVKGYLTINMSRIPPNSDIIEG